MTKNLVYERFLIANNNDEKKANEAYEIHIKWREEYVNKIKRDEIIDIIKTKQIYHYGIHEGNPICYVIIDKYDDYSNEEKIKYIVYTMETILNKYGECKLIWIIDFSKITLNKSTKNFLNDIINILSDNYPELLDKLYILNIPWYINIIKPVILFLMNNKTKEKIIFTSKNLLSNYIDKNNLSKEYNGELEIIDNIKENWDLIDVS
jgi:hypothetical protein